MADRIALDVSMINPARHPAVAAWKRLTGVAGLPTRITRLNLGHSEVYRLHGITGNRDSIIAKLCSSYDAEMTRVICTRLLPLVPKPALACYGCVEVPTHKSWIFLEDAGPMKCSFEDPAHLRAMSAWLAALHACLVGQVDNVTLPESGVDMYLKKLRAGRRKILKSLTLPETKPEDLRTLRSVLEWFEHVECQWDELKEVLLGGPRTLVHGDIAPKNILLREAGGSLDVFPIDWETGGWGPPAVDMGESLDLDMYRSEALKYGVSWSAEAIRRWAAIGKILRHIAAFEWASTSVVGGWPPRGIRRMQVRLQDAWTASAVEF